jgi:hypothetical protein
MTYSKEVYALSCSKERKTWTHIWPKIEEWLSWEVRQGMGSLLGEDRQYISMLDIIEEHLEVEWPKAYDNHKYMLNIAALVDGKGYLTESIRNDKTMNRNQHSGKLSGQAAREMKYSTPERAGLEFLYTRLVGGRTQENDLMKVMGTQGAKYANLDDFNDIAKRKMREADLHYKTALEGLLLIEISLIQWLHL